MANVKDGATSLVATAPSPATSGTSLVVTTGEAADFPTPPFYAILHPANALPKKSISEKVLVTAISTDTMTITRAQGGYTAKSVAVGWRISNAIFADDMNNASIIQNETPGGLVNSSNTLYTLASATGMVSGSLRVYLNGQRLSAGGADFTQTSTGFTMAYAPATGDVLLADYNVNGAINNVGTNSLISDEVPTGSVNSSNTTFTLSRAYIAGSLEVYINGLKQARTTHFTETTPGSGIFTMGDAPLTGDIITCNYQFNLNPASNSDTVDGIHANTTATANQLYPLNASGVYPTSVLQTNVLGYAAITSDFSTSSTTAVQVTGLTASVTIPAGGRYVKITAYSGSVYNNTASRQIRLTLWSGTVGSGTLLATSINNWSTISNTVGAPMITMAVLQPSAGAVTYNVGLHANAASTSTLEASATYPAFLLVEVV